MLQTLRLPGTCFPEARTCGRAAFVILLAALPLIAERPHRIFIRSGEKTHTAAPTRDYPAVLNSDERFLTDEEFAKADVLLVYSSGGGKIAADEWALLNTYLRRGSGFS